MAGQLKKNKINQGLELIKLLTLKHAGMLDSNLIDQHLDSDVARKVGRALADGRSDALNDTEQDLYHMVNNL